MSVIAGFLNFAKNDNRIGPIHISLFVAIIYCWQKNNCKSPVCVFSRELMELAKISGFSTYYKIVKQLHNYEYISYKPSKNRYSGSLFYVNAKWMLNVNKI